MTVANPDTAPVVETAAGPVRGTWRGAPGSAGASAAFLGIPFAQAPVGALRFAAPVPPAPWSEVRDATAYGATPQRGDMGKTLIPEPSIPGDSTLNVNVFSPDPTPGAALPVLVWIHGGGFIAGSPSSPWYDGRTFNRDGVVLVAVSYRLGFDGFGEIDGAPSNRAVLDWIAALEWVQQNVAAFGGDPARVTIGGQSAGGGAVLTLLGMERAQHLFHGALAISSALGDVPLDLAQQRTQLLAELAGVDANVDGIRSLTEERVHELQGKAGSLGAHGPAGALTQLTQGLPWGPTIDGELLPQRTIEALRAGIGADKPLLLGAADDEFALPAGPIRQKLRWVPPRIALGQLQKDRARRRAYVHANRALVHAGTPALLGRYVTDYVFRSLVARAAEARKDAPTWAYRFAWASPVTGHASHCLDVPFWFDCLDDAFVADQTGDNPPQALATAMHAAAVRFVTDGEPGWARWRTDPGYTRDFGVGPAETSDYSAKQFSVDAYDGALPLV
ncbi:carboxylesterase/lipase family protein [Microbacterium keratanolyticum]